MGTVPRRGMFPARGIGGQFPPILSHLPVQQAIQSDSAPLVEHFMHTDDESREGRGSCHGHGGYEGSVTASHGNTATSTGQ